MRLRQNWSSGCNVGLINRLKTWSVAGMEYWSNGPESITLCL